ncbi:MAG: SPOR domain-containing protein, partial [Planctomycetes bacterium]|nr:SPOR domain-containing protein [Planctomycetota bacterium]
MHKDCRVNPLLLRRLGVWTLAIAILSGCSVTGQKWSIQCVELVGSEHRVLCDQLAASLRNTPGMRASKVHPVHQDAKNRSRLCYGKYNRRTDPQTGKLHIPEKMAQELATIKNLTDPSGQRIFLGARMVPFPGPDVGDPRWDIARLPRKHTLQVAVFYETDHFHERKQAAAEYAAQLRKEGFEAYYHHGETSSEVTVGSFGEDLRAAAREVKQLREHFKYALENGRYKWNHLDDKRYR